ncbi:MAG: hypothetical protein Q8R04_06355 [Nanoarchaeota archaeon]|nr:hypothetical protein [Nanoarchaeota archaeon]
MRGPAFILLFVILLAYISFAQQSECDYKIEVLVDGEEFEKEDFKWRMRANKIDGKSTNITGTAEIKDSEGNTVKSYKPWTSDSISKQKTSSEYSPNLKSGNYEIIAEINVECSDTNKDNNIDRKTIKIKGEKEEKPVKKIESEDTKIKNKDETNNEVNNEQTKVLQKPIPKKSIQSEEIENVMQSENKNNQNIQELPSAAVIAQVPETVYASSGERAKQWIMIFLLTLSILLNIILIWKR